jgi:predicted Zn-ribbon and HTH transcriptional regulator
MQEKLARLRQLAAELDEVREETRWRDDEYIREDLTKISAEMRSLHAELENLAAEGVAPHVCRGCGARGFPPRTVDNDPNRCTFCSGEHGGASE